MKFMYALVVVLCLTWLAGPPKGGHYVLHAQAPAPGRTQFENRCGVCHGGDGNGGEYAPGMVAQLAMRNDAQLATLIREGLPGRGMPGSPNITEAEIGELTRFLRTLTPGARGLSAVAAPAAEAGAMAQRDAMWARILSRSCATQSKSRSFCQVPAQLPRGSINAQRPTSGPSRLTNAAGCVR